MDTEMITTLMTALEQSNLSELELVLGENRLHLRKQRAKAVASAPVTVPSPEPPAAPVETDIPQATIVAPLVGIVYLSPQPGAPIFKQVGDHVVAGEVVCIIESMKMMNEIKSTVTGTITEIQVENESLVEFDQVLFSVKEDV